MSFSEKPEARTSDSASPRGVSAVRLESYGNLSCLTITAPPLNILSLHVIRELRAKLETMLNRPEIRLIELRGEGRAFSAGVEIGDHFPERAPQMLREFHALIRTVLDARCPTLAVVQGHCLGGGMELALACDFIVASEDARFGQPEIRVGCFPPMAAVLLPRLIPEKRALEMILTGQPIDAKEACRWGLVNRVAPASELESAVEEFSSRLLAQSPQLLAIARKATRLGSREGFESALRESERIYLDELLPTEDAKEGLQAFLDKRPPRWKADCSSTTEVTKTAEKKQGQQTERPKP